MADEVYAVEMQKVYTGYCPVCGESLEFESEEMEESICHSCGVKLNPYCDD